MEYWVTVFAIVASICIVALTVGATYTMWLEILERKDRRK